MARQLKILLQKAAELSKTVVVVVDGLDKLEKTSKIGKVIIGMKIFIITFKVRECTIANFLHIVVVIVLIRESVIITI